MSENQPRSISRSNKLLGIISKMLLAVSALGIILIVGIVGYLAYHRATSTKITSKTGSVVSEKSK